MDFILILEWVIKALVLIFFLLGGFAYLTLYERRALARIQVRIGPNRAGPQGILQPIADALKLIFKEELTPARADKLLFILAPVVTVVPAMIIAAVIPWGTSLTMFGRQITLYVADINVGVLYLMAIASIAVYGIVMAGWSSNNKYAMMGGLRSSAQMISYELTLGLSFVSVILLSNSMRMMDIVQAQKSVWFVLLQPVGTIVFLIATIAEVNRPPFDMPEAEQELTAGYHTEYSGMKFALFFMAEYEKVIVISLIGATLYFGGFLGPGVEQHPWLGPIYMFIKLIILLFGIIWIRSTLPRLRYDRLMAFGWKVLLPLSLALVFVTALGIVMEKLWLIPILSILAAIPFVMMVNRSLWRKPR